MKAAKKITLIVLTVLTVFVLTGCGTTIEVSKYPVFYQPDIKDIAVLPFANQTHHKGLGMEVASNFAGALASNKTYKVTGPAQLDRLIKENKISALPKNNYKQVSEELGKLNEIQAFIAGEVLSESFKNIPTMVDYYDYDYYYDFDPFYPYYFYPYYYDYGTEVLLSVSASIVAVPEGAVLYTTPVIATEDITGTGGPLEKNATILAVNGLSKKMVRKFAVVPAKMTVHPDKDLKTAYSSRQDRWIYTKEFSKNSESMYVVLCLPAVATHNQFRLAIVPEKSNTNIIAEKNITWQPDKFCQGFEFSPKEIAAANGPGRYSVQFYSRGKLAMTKSFEIK